MTRLSGNRGRKERRKREEVSIVRMEHGFKLFPSQRLFLVLDKIPLQQNRDERLQCCDRAKFHASRNVPNWQESETESTSRHECNLQCRSLGSFSSSPAHLSPLFCSNSLLYLLSSVLHQGHYQLVSPSLAVTQLLCVCLTSPVC